MKAFEVSLKHMQPLLMHSPAGVDPTNPLTRAMKAITSKGSKKKTESDLEQQDWLEFQLALYHNEQGPYVPDTALLGAIRDGAKANRRGREVQAGVDIAETEIPLIYDGPRGARELYEARFVDRRPAGVQKARVMRVRPRFNQWGLTFRLLLDDKVMNPRDLRESLEYAGLRSGLLDHRPRFGRFEVSGWKEVA
jgi:hypothetical protein